MAPALHSDARPVGPGFAAIPAALALVILGLWSTEIGPMRAPYVHVIVAVLAYGLTVGAAFGIGARPRAALSVSVISTVLLPIQILIWRIGPFGHEDGNSNWHLSLVIAAAVMVGAVVLCAGRIEWRPLVMIGAGFLGANVMVVLFLRPDFVVAPLAIGGAAASWFALAQSQRRASGASFAAPVANRGAAYPNGPGYPPGAGYPVPAVVAADAAGTNGFAVAALVLGILGGWLLALIFSGVALSQIERSGGRQRGRGMAIAGLVLGVVWLAAILGFVVLVLRA